MARSYEHNGQTSVGGRRKGVPNARTFEMQERFEELGLDPLAELVKLIPSLPGPIQAGVYLKLLEFLYPKRKALEIKADINDKTVNLAYALPVKEALEKKIKEELEDES